MPPSFSGRINSINRIIAAVGKHIIPEEALPGAAVGVRIEEPLDDGVVIAGLEVIEARLLIVVVSSVPERIRVAKASG